MDKEWEGGCIPATINDQWNYLLSTIWDQMIHLVIRFDGMLSEQALASAVRSACEAEPLTTMRFQEGEPPYFVRDPDAPALTYAVITTRDPDAVLRMLLTEPLDPATGPQARVRLIRSDSDLLCISVNHSISDAYGVKTFGSRIARLYHAQSAQTTFMGLKNSHDRSFESVLRLFSPAEREEAFLTYGDQVSSWSVPMRSCTSENPEYAVVHFQPGILSSIKARAEKLGVTVNDVLLSAFTLSLAESVPELRNHALPVLTSIDLRRYLSPDSFPSLANLSVAFQVPIMAEPGASLSTVISRVHAAMDERKRGHAGIGAAERLCRDFSRGYEPVKLHLQELDLETREGGLEKIPFFSNLGVIPESVLDYGPVPVADAWMLPPVEYPPGFGLAASTCRGSLSLATGYCSRALPGKEVSVILERMAILLSEG